MITIKDVTDNIYAMQVIAMSLQKGWIDRNKLDELKVIKEVCFELSNEINPDLKEIRAVRDAIEFGGSFEKLEALSNEVVTDPIECDIKMVAASKLDLNDPEVEKYRKELKAQRERALFVKSAIATWGLVLSKRGK